MSRRRGLPTSYQAQRGALRLKVGDLATCLPRMAEWREQRISLVVADPPYNIGRNYGDTCKDNAPAWQFEAQLGEWCRVIAQGVKPGGHAFLILPPDLSPIAFMALRAAGMRWENTVAWCFRFGQNRKDRFIKAHTDCLLFSQPGAPRQWFPEDVLEPSDRLTEYADKRVEQSPWKGYRVPLDYWSGPYLGRIQGGNAERSRKHDNQIPERLVATIVRATTREGDVVVDPFTGSGTTGAVCHTLNRRFHGCELNPQLAAEAWERIKRGAARAAQILAWEWDQEGNKHDD